MREYQTLDKLEENVYTVDNGCDRQTIGKELVNFFKVLMARKRDDPFEGGLQGSMVIYHDKAGFKIAENDGLAPHAHTEETLAQYLDGDTKFSTAESLRRTALRRGDPHSYLTLDSYGFTCRVLAGSDTLLLAFVTHNEEISKFQLEVIELCVQIAKILLKKGVFKSICIGYATRQDRFSMIDKFADLSTEECLKELDTLEQMIKSRKEEIKNK